MENKLVLEDFKKILTNTEKCFRKNKEYLSKLDSFVGDGDHGLTISRGFKGVLEIIDKEEYRSVSELLKLSGTKLTSIMGGVSGIIFGSLLKAMGKSSEGKEEIDLEGFYAMFQGALDEIQKVGKAKPGDKTIVDSMDPAVTKLKEMIEKEEKLKIAILEMAEAARKGAESTRQMIAKKGRAKFLGERSIGYQDAGATSFYLMLETIAEAI
jgi:dihydroxyacetone kinase-like protein